MTERFANNASSTLNGGINNVQTTLIVNSAASFPSAGNFRLLIGNNPSTAEIVLVTNVSGATFTIVRAQEGTSASSWPDTTDVTHILTAGALNQIITAGGDLSGTVENASVIKIRGNSVTSQTLNSSTDGYALTWSNSDGYWKATPNGVLTIQDEGSSLTQRTIVDFVGSGVAATDTGSKTQVSIPGYNNTIEDEGTPVTQRTNVNFVGGGVSVADSGGKTVVTIPDTAGGDLSGTLSNASVVKIRGNSVTSQTLNASTDGYALIWSNSDGYWKANKINAFAGYSNNRNYVVNSVTSATISSNVFTNLLTQNITTYGYPLLIELTINADKGGNLGTVTARIKVDSVIVAEAAVSGQYTIAIPVITTVNLSYGLHTIEVLWKCDSGSAVISQTSGYGKNNTLYAEELFSIAASGYNTIQNNGSILTQRDTINFVGGGFNTSDVNSKTTINIPGISGSGYTWKTVYQVDFSALSTQSFSGNGSVIIDGYTWTVANFSAATSFGIVNTEGLKFTCNTSNTDYNNSTRNSLLITVPVKTLAPNFDLFSNRIRVSLYSTTNADQDFEFIVFGIEDSDSPMNLSYTMFKGYQTGGAKIASKQTIASTSTTTVDSTNTSHNISQVTFHHPFQAEIMSSTYSSGFPSQETYTPRRAFLTGNFTPTISNSNDVNIVIAAITNNTNGNFVATAKALKVEIFNSDVAVILDGYSNLPSAGVPGRLFTPTGGNHFLIDATSTWKAFGPIYSLKLPPSVSSLTWVNQGTKSVAQNNSNGTGFSIVAFPNGSNSRHLLVQTAPSAPYTFTIMANIALWPSQTTIGGIVFYENGTGKGIEFDLYFTSSTLRMQNTKFTSPTGTFTAYTDGQVQPAVNPCQIWLRQRDDGTNLTWSWSFDGINFLRLDAPRARNDFLTTAPDRIGVIVDNPGSATSGSTTTITYTVTNATNATPIQITTSSTHSLQTGEVVSISGVGGNTAANSIFFITVIDTTNFTLNGSVGNGSYTSGGTVTFEPICSKMNILHWEVTSG